MMDSIVAFTVVLALLAAVVFAHLLRGRRRLESSRSSDPKAALARLEAFLTSGRDLIIYVKVPSNTSTWRRVLRTQHGVIELEDGSASPMRGVASFVVAYKNGEIVDRFGSGRRLPPELFFMKANAESEPFELSDDALRSGAHFLDVRHLRALGAAAKKGTYETHITNVCTVPVRIRRFAGFARSADGAWKLHTVSGGFYDDRQFREWYGLGEVEWIEPGQTVKDPDNYGGPRILWAYFGQSVDGAEFTAGAVAE